MIEEPVRLIPPKAVEIESKVLGAMIIDATAVPKGIELLTEDAFHVDYHAKIWKAMVVLFQETKPIDAVTLAEQLRKNGHLETVGGEAYLTELTKQITSAVDIEYNARILLEKMILRTLISQSNALTARAFSPTEDALTLLDEAEQMMFNLRNHQQHRGFVGMMNAVHVTLEALEGVHARTKALTGIPTGFRSLDMLTGGWQNSDLIIVAGRPSSGKAQPLSANILTPTGFRTMGELAVGDAVIGADGRAHNITGIFPQGKQRIFRVAFVDGSSTLCTSDHLWTTSDKEERGRDTSSVKSLDAIALRLRRGKLYQHSIPLITPVHFRRSSDLDLHPYVLGLYLGDGSCSGQVRFSNPEVDIQERFAAFLPKEDMVVDLGNGLDFRVKRRQRNNDTSETLRCLRLYSLDDKDSYTKFIPQTYLMASIPERIQLLQGLNDSDGHVASRNGAIEYTTSSLRLASDICFLARSLGGMVRTTSKTATFISKGEKKTGARSWRIAMSFPAGGIIPIASVKHLKKWQPRRRVHHKIITDIALDGEKECQCIAVDSADGLYVTDDFIVTHNTAFALSLARNAAGDREQPTGIGIFSLEMTTRQLSMRLLAAEARVDAHQLRTGRLPEDEWQRLSIAAGRLVNLPVFIDDTAAMTILELRAKARRMKAERNVGLIVVDYLQLMQGPAKMESREKEISAISRSLKALAKELNIPVIALSQLSREIEKRSDKRPILSDLRESGAIEQDADLVVFVHRPEMFLDPESEQAKEMDGIAEIIVGKQRSGPTDDVKLAFVKRYARFENPSLRAPNMPAPRSFFDSDQENDLPF